MPTTWVYGTVLHFPTLADFQVSNVRTGMFLMKDTNGVMAGWARDADADETGTEGVDWVKNASDVHYRRKDVITP